MLEKAIAESMFVSEGSGNVHDRGTCAVGSPRLRFARGLTALFFVLGTSAACLSDSMLYPIPDVPVPLPPPGTIEHALVLPSGARATLWLQTTTVSSFDLLYLHGNGENLGTLIMGGFLDTLARVAPIHALDYPGYGRSSGRPSEQENIEAALAALGTIRSERGRPVVLIGWSLGAAVATATAARAPGQLRALVLLSPWYSLDSVARRHFPGWLVTLFRRETYDSGTAGASLRLPVLIVHGEADALIDVAEGTRLARAIPGARLVRVPGAGHNDLPGQPDTLRALRSFLDELRPAAVPAL